MAGGFAVVADEVGKLATRSAASAMSGATERLACMARQLQEATARFRASKDEVRDLPGPGLAVGGSVPARLR